MISTPRWHTVAQVAQLLNSWGKRRMLINHRPIAGARIKLPAVPQDSSRVGLSARWPQDRAGRPRTRARSPSRSPDARRACDRPAARMPVLRAGQGRRESGQFREECSHSVPDHQLQRVRDPSFLSENENRGIRCVAPDAGHRGRALARHQHSRSGAECCRRDLAADERTRRR